VNVKGGTKGSKILLCALVIVSLAAFWWLDSMRISTGDDLGYMFTDSKLHCGDGEQVQSLADCLLTQSMHYFSTNGRILVHGTVQAMLAVFPHWVFTLVNTLMFGLLWWGVVLLSCTAGRDKLNIYVWMMALVFLWLTLPAVGMSMLSLVAYSVGYLWTSAVCVLWLYCLKWQYASGGRHSGVWVVFSIFAGMLHEGISLPVCATLLCFTVLRVISVLKKKERVSHLIDNPAFSMMLAFGAATLFIVLAPGNFSHLGEAGGMGAGSLLRRQMALWPEVGQCAVGFLFVVLLICYIFRHHETLGFCRANRLELTVILFSVLMAMFTYTSPRQLFWPSVLSVVLLVKVARGLVSRMDLSVRRAVGVGMAVSLGVVMSVAGYFRSITLRNWNNFIERYRNVVIKSGNTVIYDVRECNYNACQRVWKMFARFDCDPAEGSVLHVFFDGYTKRGLSRFYCHGDEHKVVHLVPYSVASSSLHISDVGKNGRVHTTPLDGRYAAVALPSDNTQKAWQDAAHRHLVPYEEYKTKDGLRVLVVPAVYKEVYLD